MVKMNLPSSDNQATSIGRVSASRIGAYESAMQALGSFIGAEGLSGQAYDNAKDYAASTLLPLLKAAILYEESLSEAVKRLPSDYRATEYLEGKSLDSEDLEAELARLESVGMRLERSIDHALAMASDYPDYEWHAHSMMRQLNQVIDRKNKVRRQLQALYAFNERSSSFFSGIGDLETQLSQGIVQVGSDMSNFSGSFPSGLSPVWVSKVNQKWNDRVKRMRDTSSPADFRKLEERGVKYSKDLSFVKSLITKTELTNEDLTALSQIISESPEIIGYVDGESNWFENTINYLISDERGDNFERGMQLLSLMPATFIDRILQSDGFWEVAGSLSSNNQTKLITVLAKYETIAQHTKWIETGLKYVKDASSPILTFIQGTKAYQWIAGNTGGLIGLAGKAGTAITVFDLLVTGVYEGYSVFQETGNAVKSVIDGTLEAVSSIGLLEGMTLGAATGAAIGGTTGTMVVPGVGTVSVGVVGGIVGGLLGGANSVLQFFYPNAYDGAKDFLNNFYTKTESLVNDTANSVGDWMEDAADSIGNWFEEVTP
ncbi:T7SS effector LXG polymorphic toxin [Streptococcus suis]|uniref:T7SS effector LXG polymorphic toxin n=1 Tax=Streptococcus suis TaxID=1307 RepID=UPI0004628CCF|nr:T7SS effector LXG polymorphic toxin [Streptococcus suis]